ncbi:AlbA family DNA-binding domain-containing protein [Labilibaculum euxinus]|uniref:ATP-binding protein n=1 Tax=Labilibaculum euxinus TaxID=2686357 RepID=A0A7M4D9R6_9BACT|nr:ATP-binding protein [Labilibaculum euxinus]MUP39395.1 ATP-binding protein [Labilibaculum euxinus]MVB08600.1 ATP-binding protein [Labilibaculum euxinus]
MNIIKGANLQIRNQELLIHSLVGLLVGFFILHPISMVIYWFDTHGAEYSLISLGKVISDSFSHAFSLHMIGMSIAFSVLGGVIGFGSGLYYRSLKRKDGVLFGKRKLLEQSIPSLIKEGENEFVEFKSSLRHDYYQVKMNKNLEMVIMKSIAGFLNAKGGTLLIGVDDFGEVLGLDNDYFTLKKNDKDGFQQRLITLVSNTFGKNTCAFLNISFHLINRREICTVVIQPSVRPVYVNENSRTIFYLRTGNVTNPLTTSETVGYLQSRQIIKN